MAIDTIHVRTEPSTGGESSHEAGGESSHEAGGEASDAAGGEASSAPGVVDVSDLPAARLRELVGEAADGVYLERRAGRTFLVATA